MSTTATDNTTSPNRNFNNANQSANFVIFAKDSLVSLFKKNVNPRHGYSGDPVTSDSDEFKPLLSHKGQTTKNAFGTEEGPQIVVLQNKSSYKAQSENGEIRLVIETDSGTKLLTPDPVQGMELHHLKSEQDGDALMMNEVDQELLKEVWDLIKQIKKDGNSSTKLLKKLNEGAAKDAKATAQVLHIIRNRMMFGPEVSLKDRVNGLLSFYSVLKNWGQEGAATLKIYATLDSSNQSETLSRQVLAKFSETTIVIVKVVIQEEMFLGITKEKANYWCGVLQKLKEHCLLQDVQHSKSYLVLAFHNLLTELTKHEETKCVVTQYAIRIKENLPQLVEKVFGNKKLPMDSLIRSTVATTYRQYQFIKEFSSESPDEVVASVLSKIYELTYNMRIPEKHKREDEVQFFFQCVAFQTVHFIELSGPILTQLSNAHEKIVDGLASAIYAWFKKDEEILFKLIKSCCESEARTEKEDSAFRGKTLSIILSNHFNMNVNRSFHANMVKLLKGMLSQCKKPVNLCMTVRTLRDYELNRDLLLGKLDETALSNCFLGLNLNDMRQELENVPLEHFPKIAALPKPFIYSPKNHATFFDFEIGELPGDLKTKLNKIELNLTDTIKLAQLIGENPSIPLLKKKLPVNQLSLTLINEINNLHGNEYENKTVGDLIAAKLEKGLKEKIQSEVERNYEKLFDQLKTQAKRVHDKKAIQQAIQSLNKDEFEIILRRVHFTQLSAVFQNNYCEKVCEKNKTEFTDFMSKFLKSFYQTKLHQRSRKLLEIRREVIKKHFPQLEVPLTGNILLLRWILPEIVNEREWDKNPFHRSIVTTVTAILQRLSMEGEEENTQIWASVYNTIKENFHNMHQDFIDRNSKSEETSTTLKLKQ